MAASTGISKDAPLPYYEQLKRLLVAQMESGELHSGDMLPSEFELCAHYGVSRTVVRQALGELAAEGRLYRLRGKGTFIARPQLREQFMESTVAFFEDLPTSGDALRRKVLRCELVAAGDAPPELELPTTAKCVEIDRLRRVDGAVVSLTRHVLPATLHDDLLGAARSFDLERNSIYRFLEDVCGVRVHSGHRSLEAIRSPDELAQLLEMPAGDPVLYVRSVGRERTGQPVEFFEAWHRGDRIQFEIDVAGPARSRTPV